MASGWWYTYPSDKSWTSSVGMMTFPNMMESQNPFMFQTTNQMSSFQKPRANTERNTPPACLFWPNRKAKRLPILGFSSHFFVHGCGYLFQPSYWMVSKIIKNGRGFPARLEHVGTLDHATAASFQGVHGMSAALNHLLPGLAIPSRHY